jgi:hypothetical protein
MLPDDEQIRQRAYEIWEREGRPDGREAEHWRLAADELGASTAQREKMEQELQNVPAARMRGPAKLDESPAPKAAPQGGPGAAPRPDPQSDPLGLAQPGNKAAAGKRNGPPRGAKPRMPDASPAPDTKAPDRTR